MKILFVATILLVTTMLSACGSLNPAIAGYEKTALASTRAANDNYVEAIEAAICSVPVGAVIRHPEFVPIAKSACLPNGNPDINSLIK